MNISNFNLLLFMELLKSILKFFVNSHSFVAINWNKRLISLDYFQQCIFIYYNSF